VELCEYCELCTDNCCDCPYCDSCSGPADPDRFCRNCDSCESHGNCGSAKDDERVWQGSGRSIRLVNNHNQPFHYPKTKKDHHANPSSRLLAVEIEVAGLKANDHGAVNTVCEKWGCNIVTDGSLPSSGFEINTAPAGGDHWLHEIDEICAALKQGQAGVTQACGLHCHIDCRDFKYYDMRRLLFLYAKLEEGLYHLLPPWRRASSYCVPCGAKFILGLAENKLPKASKDQLVSNLYGTKDTRPYRRDRHHSTRYNAWNIHSWFYRGSIECRLFPGTVNPTKMKYWGMLLAGLCDTAYRLKETDVTALDSGSLAKKIKLLQTCAPTPEVAAWVDLRYRKWNPRRA